MKTGRIFVLALVAVLAVTLSGCAGKDRERDPNSAAEMYASAQRSMSNNNFVVAAEMLERLEARHPFSREAQQAQIDLIYAYYRANNFEQAQAASDRFLREQPRHPNIDYAHYLRGLINFDRSLNLLDELFRVDPARRDPTLARQSFQSFSALVNNFPESRYVPDAQQRMIHLRNLLARHEIYVARHYMELGAWVAAANRARTVVEEYQETPSTVDALVILHNAYRKMDMDDLAEDVARVVAANYPDAQRRLQR